MGLGTGGLNLKSKDEKGSEKFGEKGNELVALLSFAKKFRVCEG